MKVDYQNVELTDTHARVTFIGRDARGKVRRPVVDFEAGDLAQLVTAAKDFRDHQLALARKHEACANTINNALQETT